MAIQTSSINKPSLLSQIFKRKNLDEILAASENAEHKLKKTLTAFDLVIFGVGAMIGAGIFVLTGSAAAGSAGHLAAGPALTLSFVLTGLVCSFCALAYAEFASMVPISGSAYTYTYSTMGQMMAWVIGWALVLEYAVGNMAVAVGWTGHVKEFLLETFGYTLPAAITSNTVDIAFSTAEIQNPDLLVNQLHFNILGTDIFLLINAAFNIPAFIIVLAVTALLYVGVQESARSAAIMVFVKTAVVLMFIAVGGFFLFGNGFAPLKLNWFQNGMDTFAPNGWGGIITGASTIFFAYIGFDAVSTAAEETKNPQRDIPIGILGSLAICTLLYILVTAVITAIVPLDQINREAAVSGTMSFVGMSWASMLINIGAIAGLTSVLLVLQMGATRIFFAISRDKLLPAPLAKIHPKFQTPTICTVVIGGFVAVFAALLPIHLLAEMCNIGTLGAFIVVSLGVIMLRYTDADRQRPFRCPGGIVLPAIGVVGCAYIASGLPSITWALFVGWFALGMVIYFAYGLPNSIKAQQAAIPARTGQPIAGLQERGGTIQVPLVGQPTESSEPVGTK
ncbi:MAG: amino acid permease [Cyanobacteria bacterium HKST-UBA03]|nr:amino acid permease [Cyanobacteria bacterium HKST-UBA03]